MSGVEVTHPDKGTEMFLYELAVDEDHRRRGHARALVEALGALARERGCVGMFVFVDDDNEAGRAAYRSAGRRPRPRGRTWSLTTSCTDRSDSVASQLESYDKTYGALGVACRLAAHEPATCSAPSQRGGAAVTGSSRAASS